MAATTLFFQKIVETTSKEHVDVANCMNDTETVDATLHASVCITNLKNSFKKRPGLTIPLQVEVHEKTALPEGFANEKITNEEKEMRNDAEESREDKKEEEVYFKY